MFISFEGGEGSGKTTQIAKLQEMLVACGHDVVTTREPGGVPEAENIRKLLVQRDGGAWNAMSEVLLIFAARVMHVENLIKPALCEGKIIICDRFSDSTIAYQGYGRGVEITKIKEIEKLSIGDFKPDITFILDIDPRAGLLRSNARLSDEDSTEDRFERMDINFHEKLRKGFLEIASQDKKRCYIINAAQGVEEIFNEVKNITLTKL